MRCEHVQDVTTLLSVIGSNNSVALATSLLAQNKGSIEAAVNAFYDPPTSRGGTKASSQTTQKPNAASKGGHTGNGGRSRTLDSPARPKATKRTANGAPASSPASKASRQQKSIVSFFKAGSSNSFPATSPAKPGTPVKLESVETQQWMPPGGVHATAPLVDAAEDEKPPVSLLVADAGDTCMPEECVPGTDGAEGAEHANHQANQLDVVQQEPHGRPPDHAEAVRGEVDGSDQPCPDATAPEGDRTGASQDISVTANATAFDGSSQLLPLDKCGETL